MRTFYETKSGLGLTGMDVVPVRKMNQRQTGQHTRQESWEPSDDVVDCCGKFFLVTHSVTLCVTITPKTINATPADAIPTIARIRCWFSSPGGS